MKCSKCGKSVSNDIKFCPDCGSKIKHEKLEKGTRDTYNKKSCKWLWITLSMIIGIIIIFALIFSIYQTQSLKSRIICQDNCENRFDGCSKDCVEYESEPCTGPGCKVNPVLTFTPCSQCENELEECIIRC